MPYALRTFACTDCGEPVQWRRPAGSRQRCHPCGIKYSAEVQRQLAAHEGPIWEKWRWRWMTGTRLAVQKAASREAVRAA